MFVVTNTSAAMIIIAGQSILPGATSAPIKDEWIDGVKNSPSFRAGKLREGKVDMPPPEVVSLTKMSLDQCRKMIGAETRLSTLTTWQDAEKRTEVLAMIADRVRKL
jgi:hypothetical protein